MFLVENHSMIASCGRRVRLLIVGPDLEPDYAAAVRRKVAELGCGDMISLVVIWMIRRMPTGRATYLFLRRTMKASAMC